MLSWEISLSTPPVPRKLEIYQAESDPLYAVIDKFDHQRIVIILLFIVSLIKGIILTFRIANGPCAISIFYYFIHGLRVFFIVVCRRRFHLVYCGFYISLLMAAP